MSRQSFINQILAVSAIALALNVSAQAKASRTFVSTTGNDSNTSANCSASATCRSFGAALGVTTSGGEIVVLKSGGYGPAAIDMPVTITAMGVDASISVTTSGQNGITIHTPGNVTLIGLNLHGEATGNNGIEVQQVGSLRLYDMLIENFLSNGVNFVNSSATSPGNLVIDGCAINDNHAGLTVFNATSPAYVQNSSFGNNSEFGVVVGGGSAGSATVADSDVYNSASGFAVIGTGAVLTLLNDRVEFNAYGLDVESQGKLYLAHSLIADNTIAAYYIDATGSKVSGTSPETNLIAPGQLLSGTLSAPLALK